MLIIISKKNQQQNILRIRYLISCHFTWSIGCLYLSGLRPSIHLFLKHISKHSFQEKNAHMNWYSHWLIYPSISKQLLASHINMFSLRSRAYQMLGQRYPCKNLQYKSFVSSWSLDISDRNDQDVGSGDDQVPYSDFSRERLLARVSELEGEHRDRGDAQKGELERRRQIVSCGQSMPLQSADLSIAVVGRYCQWSKLWRGIQSSREEGSRHQQLLLQSRPPRLEICSWRGCSTEPRSRQWSWNKFHTRPAFQALGPVLSYAHW